MRRPGGTARGLLRAAVSLGAAASLGAIVLGGWSFADFLARIEPEETLPNRHADGAVALTGGADRVTDAIDLLTSGRVDRLLITGVNPQTTQAEILRQRPNARAAFDCCIELGYEAANTVGNALETERWVRTRGLRSVIVVTSNYHMPRALAEIGSAIPEAELLPYPVVSDHARTHPWWVDPQSTRLILLEWAKYVAATARLRLVGPRLASATPDDGLARTAAGPAQR